MMSAFLATMIYSFYQIYIFPGFGPLCPLFLHYSPTTTIFLQCSDFGLFLARPDRFCRRWQHYKPESPEVCSFWQEDGKNQYWTSACRRIRSPAITWPFIRITFRRPESKKHTDPKQRFDRVSWFLIRSTEKLYQYGTWWSFLGSKHLWMYKKEQPNEKHR